MVKLLAQVGIEPDNLPDASVGKALLEGSIQLNQATVESWNEFWQEVISPQSPLWIGLCTFGFTLAALSIIFVSLKMAADYQQGRFSWAELVGSLSDITLTEAVRQRISAILAECYGKPPDQLNACLVEKQPIIEQIVTEAEEIHGGTLEAAREWLDDVGAFFSQPGAAFSAAIAAIFISLLQGLQWAFVNILEASLLMTASLAPVAMGLSLLPLGTRPIWDWASGFMGLFGIQIGYTIIVGLAATVIVKAGAQGISDLAFLSFISIFAPGIAVLLGSGGGVSLYLGLNNYALNLARTVADIGILVVKALV